MCGCSASDGSGLKIIDGENSGLIQRHAYSIIDVIEIPWNEEELQIKSNYH